MTDKPEVAAKPVAYLTNNPDGNPFDWPDSFRDHECPSDWTPLYTHPLVAPEREVLRELVRLHDMPMDEWNRDDGNERMTAAWDAARALLRNTPEAGSIDGGNMG